MIITLGVITLIEKHRFSTRVKCYIIFWCLGPNSAVEKAKC